LDERDWRLKYSPEDGDLVERFYVPALECAVRYDRGTGYFTASALALAMRGIEGLIANGGRMRLLVGCTLGPGEVDAIRRGEELRKVVARALGRTPLLPPDDAARDALELLAWMVAHAMLDVKVAIPCDRQRRPIPDEGLYHEKAGVIRDGADNRIAFNGSINETEAGWRRNFETFHVFRSWASDEPRVAQEETSFERAWNDESPFITTVTVPDAIRDDLLRFLPKDDLPARLRPKPLDPEMEPEESEEPISVADRRAAMWEFIANAAKCDPGGEWVGIDTSAVEPWPHQVHAFRRMYRQQAPRLLIADEVGLGKTIQAGMLLRQMLLAGRAKRVLVLAPAALLRQWQLELREKLNLNWPIYDDGRLRWLASPGMPAPAERRVARDGWHREPAVIASSHLMRRGERADELCEAAEPWDLVVLDEAHHARRRGAGTPGESGPNALLRLMRRLRERTRGLLLLTATPMQVHPVELWDLMDLLGLPPSWNERAFLRFFELLEKPSPSHDELDELARQFRAAESDYGSVQPEAVLAAGAASPLRASQVLRALRETSSIPRRSLSAPDRSVALRVMRRHTPIAALVSRNTRALLRRYHEQGLLETPIARREVDDRFIEMSEAEAAVYHDVEQHIATTYDRAAKDRRTAVGFVMTVYRRRMASSFRALRQTLRARRVPLTGYLADTRLDYAEDASDDESRDDVMDAEDVAHLEREAIVDERAGIERLLGEIGPLPADSKARALGTVLAELQDGGYGQVMVFTQYTDTLDFLREYLAGRGFAGILCFSGRGGEVRDGTGHWRTVSRDEVKRRFREGRAAILLCTDAAAEGLNFQFCGAVVNYDLPWNPMKVEQRIGRIDRLGQQHAVIRVVNLHYRDTVEADVYIALRERIRLFESFVGRLQPILARMPGRIEQIVLSAGTARDAARRQLIQSIEAEAARAGEDVGLDIDEAAMASLDPVERPSPILDLPKLDAVIRDSDMLPPGTAARRLGTREYAWLAPGMAAEVRVTTDATFFEQHPDSVELWSPGSPVFPG
jgi:ERCC4-related helicase